MVLADCEIPKVGVPLMPTLHGPFCCACTALADGDKPKVGVPKIPTLQRPFCCAFTVGVLETFTLPEMVVVPWTEVGTGLDVVFSTVTGAEPVDTGVGAELGVLLSVPDPSALPPFISANVSVKITNPVVASNSFLTF